MIERERRKEPVFTYIHRSELDTPSHLVVIQRWWFQSQRIPNHRVQILDMETNHLLLHEPSQSLHFEMIRRCLIGWMKMFFQNDQWISNEQMTEVSSQSRRHAWIIHTRYRGFTVQITSRKLTLRDQRWNDLFVEVDFHIIQMIVFLRDVQRSAKAPRIQRWSLTFVRRAIIGGLGENIVSTIDICQVASPDWTSTTQCQLEWPTWWMRDHWMHSTNHDSSQR